MKKIKKIISLMLCVCISSYTLPVFAIQTVDDSSMEVQKIMLSDVEMNGLVGAGAVDATVSDYAGNGMAEAVFVNRSGSLACSYTLNEVDSYGVIVGEIASGLLSPNTAIIASGPLSTTQSGYGVEARIWHSSFLGLQSKDGNLR